MLDQRLTYLTLGVNDLPKMKEFYETKFGWIPMAAEESIVFFRLNGFILSLYPHDALAADAQVDGNAPAYKGFTLAYNLGSEQEVNDLMEKLAAAGVKVVKPAEKVFWGGYSGYIADVENNLWEIAYNPFLALDAQGNVAAEQS